MMVKVHLIPIFGIMLQPLFDKIGIQDPILDSLKQIINCDFPLNIEHCDQTFVELNQSEQ
jgi:hypothetical protein